VWRAVKEAGFKYLHTRNLNQDFLENTFGAIHLYCGLNNNPTVGQFVVVLKISIINGCVKLIMRVMVLLFWITCNHCSGHLMLHEIVLQVMARKPLMMFLIVSMLLRKY
jgi:hypothetical protein